MAERFKPNVTVAGIVVWQEWFLMVEEVIDGETVYNQPAGHLEANESIQSACEREILEETGIATKCQSMTGIYQYKAAEELDFLRFTFHCIVNQYGTTLEPPQTRPQDPQIVASHWMTLDEIKSLESQLRSPLILKSIKDYQEGKSASLNTLSDEFLTLK
ncbi:NUDIX hydrolase [Parashewanella spongiae]|uniref:Phosphatase NudJ n=1 Tax=Parashewanella spongiae TaxID=342950 RepID=A0A3A6ULW9_9GAMM|nr:NUDIX hydrolase [Parashewanella spongiae]MCL1077221.1 NUDIX hydrolase [Parashewanella spongiae]RJY18700.1 NUDIX hydrolase [Parashewanella spongiae]